MRALIQRVSNASVTIDGEEKSAIERGFLILLGVGQEDTEEQADKLWGKISKLRIFDDENGKTNLSLADIWWFPNSRSTPAARRAIAPRSRRRARPTRQTACTNISPAWCAQLMACVTWEPASSVQTCRSRW